MPLFTPGFDTALHCDAYLVDSQRLGRPLAIAAHVPPEPVVDALLERVVLMGKSLYPVRERTFALFFGERAGELVAAPSEPFHADVSAVLGDALAAFGAVRECPDEPLDTSGLAPLLAYERGRVSFLDSAPTHRFLPLAGRRGLRILAATCTHAPAPSIEVLEQA